MSRALIASFLVVSLILGMFMFVPDNSAEYDEEYYNKYNQAKLENKVLRYIGSWNGEIIKVGLRAVSRENFFYFQKGRENYIVIKSERYNSVPIIIRGHGAGVVVTAAGVYSDINACRSGG